MYRIILPSSDQTFPTLVCKFYKIFPSVEIIVNLPFTYLSQEELTFIDLRLYFQLVKMYLAVSLCWSILLSPTIEAYLYVLKSM